MSTDLDARALALKDEAFELQRAGRYLDAEKPLLQAIALWKLARGPQDLEVLAAEMNLAVSYRRRGEPERALPILERVVSELEVLPFEPEAAQVHRLACNNLAACYRHTGQLDKALGLLEMLWNMLDIPEMESVPDDHEAKLAWREERARILDNTADVLTQMNDLARAEVAATRANAEWVALRGQDDVDVAISLTHVGTIAMKNGHLDAARGHLRRSLELLERLLGPEHPHVAAALNVLGVSALLAGRLEEARAHAQRSLAISRRTLSDDHHLVIEALDLLEQVERVGAGPSS